MNNENNNSKEKIKSAALQLFKEKGYESVTITQICKVAGCSPSTFYYQFGTKNNLLHSYTKVLTVIDHNILSSLLVLTTAWEKLWKIHESFVDTLLELGVSLYLEMLSSNLKSEVTFSESDSFNESSELIIPLILQGQKNGEIRNLTPAADLAKTVTIQMMGVNYLWCVNKGAYDLKSMMKHHLSNLYDLREDFR